MVTVSLKCPHCGNIIYGEFTGPEQGVIVPCQCKEAREAFEREHYIRNDRKKKLRSNLRKKEK